MRHLIIGFILLLASIYLGIEISKANSYVLVTYGHWMIETSLWAAIIAFIILFIIIYVLLRLIGKTAGIPRHFKRWKKARNDRKARVLTKRGLCELAEGYWAKSEATLTKAAHISKRPLIDYLAAAKAAQAQHAFDRRDKYLRRAHQTDKDAAIAIGLTQAQLQMDGEQWEQANATLQHLYQIVPTHCFLLKLLATVYTKLNEWQKCESLLKPIKKHKALTDDKYHLLARRVYFELLHNAAQKDAAILNSFWKSLAREYQQDNDFVYGYAKALLHLRHDDAAEKVIEHQLKKHWGSNLVRLFSQIRHSDADKPLSTAQHWLKSHPNDATLLLCLGNLSLQAKHWGNAKDFLQQSIDIQACAQAYIKLGKVYEMLHEQEKAQENFQAALDMIDQPKAM